MKTAGVGPEPIDLGQLGNGGQRVLFGDIDAGAASGRGDFWLIGKKPLVPACAQTFTLRSAC